VVGARGSIQGAVFVVEVVDGVRIIWSFFFPKKKCAGDDGSKVIVDSRKLKDTENAVVTYHNPLDNVPDLARIFYDRC
jgi:hypothetical protein